MATAIRMPQLGESVAEGTLGRWLKQPGDWIDKDEPLAEIITDKVNAELPSPVAGRVEALLIEEGATVDVGHEIARIATAAEVGAAPTGGPVASLPDAAPPAADDEERVDLGMFSGALDSLDAPLVGTSPSLNAAGHAATEPAAIAPGGEPRRIRSSPLVRRLAEEHQVDLAGLQGTGLGGRITKDDILNYLTEREEESEAGVVASPALPAATPILAAPPVGPAPAAAPPVGAAPVAPLTPSNLPLGPSSAGAGEERQALTPMRRTIAEHLTRAHQTIPRAWTLVEVDLTALVRWRERVREEFRRREGVDLTYLAPFVQVVVEAIKESPAINARWGEDHVMLRRGIHIGIAVARDDGLVVPVLHGADERSLVGIARGVADLVARARAGTLALSDVQGATLTVNNTGAFGSVVSAPIVPHGQTGIVTLEAIVKRPVVVDDAIAIRSMANVCLSFDHRVLDGAQAGHFLQGIKRRLEQFQPPL